MSEITAFMLFGVFCGFVFGIGDDLSKIICNDIISFIYDALSVILCTLVFFCLYVGYSNGYVRYYCFVLIMLTMILYLLTVHKKVLKKTCKVKAYYNIMKKKKSIKKGDKSESKGR